jgi:hypothetical protein
MGKQLYYGGFLALAVVCVSIILIIVFWVNKRNTEFRFMNAWLDTSNPAQFATIWFAALCGATSLAFLAAALYSPPECERMLQEVSDIDAKTMHDARVAAAAAKSKRGLSTSWYRRRAN